METYPQKFKYTKNSAFLTDEQRQFYEDNGFIVFKKLISDEILDQCLQRFVDICTKKVAPQGNTILMKDLELAKTGKTAEHLYYKINDFLYDDVFFQYAVYKKLVDVVSSIIGNNITATHSMLINKPPGSTCDASRHPMHQDQYYFPFGPPENVVAAWTALETINEKNALETINEKNGCLFVLPGTHKGKLYHHDYPQGVANKAFYGVQGFDDHPRVNLIMNKGDTVFFHPVILHGSGPNTTQGFRRAISVHYVDTNCEFYDFMGTKREEIANEIVQMFAKKNVILPYQDIWKYKGRLIRGPAGNFQKYTSRL
ncbi:Phytanoyl-CoA dioxygenase (PhyH) [Popillia japonica]|uniref:phytanoyl-CoA dioxygenase n=1 Tax=Popillia japonica TaxID=7064 RepID=A0AAW1L641_POPJA